MTAGKKADACGMLTKGFPNEVRAQTGKSIPAATAAALLKDAARIANVLGC